MKKKLIQPPPGAEKHELVQEELQTSLQKAREETEAATKKLSKARARLNRLCQPVKINNSTGQLSDRSVHNNTSLSEVSVTQLNIFNDLSGNDFNHTMNSQHDQRSTYRSVSGRGLSSLTRAKPDRSNSRKVVTPRVGNSGQETSKKLGFHRKIPSLNLKASEACDTLYWDCLPDEAHRGKALADYFITTSKLNKTSRGLKILTNDQQSFHSPRLSSHKDSSLLPSKWRSSKSKPSTGSGASSKATTLKRCSGMIFNKNVVSMGSSHRSRLQDQESQEGVSLVKDELELPSRLLNTGRIKQDSQGLVHSGGQNGSKMEEKFHEKNLITAPTAFNLACARIQNAQKELVSGRQCLGSGFGQSPSHLGTSATCKYASIQVSIDEVDERSDIVDQELFPDIEALDFEFHIEP